MNYKLIQPPIFTDTLDFENVNAPFIALDKNQYFLTKKAKELAVSVEELRIYTDKDSINLVSNGISNYFNLKLKPLTVEILGDPLISGTTYIKDDTPEESITVSSPLNMKELVAEMQNKDFLSREYIYKQLLDKTKLSLSNMIGYSDMVAVCIKRTVVPVELVNPECIMGIKKDVEIVNRNTMEDEFIHKTIVMDQLNIKEDAITSIDFDSIIAYDVEFEDGYVPTDPTDSISIGFAKEEGYLLREDMREKVFIEKPEQGNSPINKEKAIDMSGKYISTIDKDIENIIIKRNSAVVIDEFIISSDEAKLFIDDYFNKITDPTIDNFDEFSNYLQSLCEFNEEFILYDFKIDGGKIYLGFDYNNMFSVFNSEAIKRILFEELGAFNIRNGITFDSSRYFKDQVEINKLAAYAQLVDKDFDISIDTIGQVFKQIRGIVSKLCILSPDAIPSEEDPVDIPVFKPSTVIAAMALPNYVVSYIRPNIDMPYYYQEYKLFIITPLSVSTSNYSYPSGVYIEAPVYIEDFVFSIITPPAFNLTAVNYTPPEIDKPTPRGEPIYNTFNREDGKKDRLIFFDTENGCKKRYKIVSTRTINLMDIGVMFAKVPDFGVMWYSYEESITMPAALGAISFMSDVSCIVAKESGYFVNITLRLNNSAPIDNSEASVIQPNSGCGLISNSGSEGSSDGNTIRDTYSSAYFELNGKGVDAYGVIVDSPIITATEFASGSPSEVSGSTVKFEDNHQYRDDDWWAMVKAYAAVIISDTQSYIAGRRLDDWTSITVRPAPIKSLGNVTPSDGVNYILAEYARTRHEKRAKNALASMADPLGIFYSFLDIDTTIKELVYPYDNVLVGNTSGQVIDDRVEYMRSPPPPESGDEIIYIWAPNLTADYQKIEKMPYISISNTSQGVVSTFEPVVYIKKVGNSSYKLDYVGGDGSLDWGIEAFETVRYYDGSSELEDRYVVRFLGKTLVLGAVKDSSIPGTITFTRDVCDPWESPYAVHGVLAVDDAGSGYGSVAVSDSMIPVVSFSGLQSIKDMEFDNVNVQISGGCGPGADGVSGIDPSVKENISNLEDINPDTLYQAPGETPGAISLNLSLKLSKYAPDVDTSGDKPVITREVIKTADMKVCLTFGIIDGLKDANGDVLAQGLSQEQIDAIEGEEITYVSPNELVLSSTSMERKIIGGKDASVFTLNLASMISDAAIETESEKPFVEYIDPRDGETKPAKVVLRAEAVDPLAESSLGFVVVQSFATPGLSFMYKHAGQDPHKPIVQGYQGSSEVNFINGKRLVATIPTPLPNVTVTGLDDATQIIEALDLSLQTSVYFFINNETMQVVIPDSMAAFSEKRIIKVQNGQK